MKGNEHRALAQYLLRKSNNKSLYKYRRAFLLGCIEPDYNPFTYMRGFVKHKSFMGHNAENSRKHVVKCINDLQENGLNSAFDFFTLGTIVHYISDAFTYAHNGHFPGKIKDHNAYERDVRKSFTKILVRRKSKDFHRREDSLSEYFTDKHAEYRTEEESYVERDCRYISKVCIKIFRELLDEADLAMEAEQRKSHPVA